MSGEHVREALGRVAARVLPRILSQACRDPRSPAYGCFDRNWWHYKIRDFPSVILQQGAVAVWRSIEKQPAEMHDGLRRLVEGSCRFWNARARRHGAFEEYYPWEQGYPPVAFSALAIARLVAAGAASRAAVAQGLGVAARQLQTRFEAQAGNQQVAGLAALAWMRKVAPELVDDDRFEALSSRALALQTPDGWYQEYGGPDLGYLSVTLDCLWDLYDATGDERFRGSAARGLEFIAAFAALPWHGAAMHNARNTDYLVPYGISRFLAEEGSERETAAQVMAAFFADADAPEHFLQAVDDRYWCHYIGPSLFRALDVLAASDVAAPPAAAVRSRVFESSGHVILRPEEEGPVLLLSGRKGGVFTAWCRGATVSDFGWTVRSSAGHACWVSHWWAEDGSFDAGAAGVTVRGRLARHVERVSSPLGHMALRVLSLVLGRRIIAFLKNRLIFKRQRGGPLFQRTVRMAGTTIEVEDELGVGPAAQWERAPRGSVRHVASADSYHREDMALAVGWTREEEVTEHADNLRVRTTYRLCSREEA